MSHPNSFRFFRVLKMGFVALAFGSQLAAANEQKTIPDLNLVLVKLEPGTFTLGRVFGVPPDAGVERDETPETKVTLTKGFWLGATEVTVAQWRVFAEATGYLTEPEKSGAGIMVWVDGNPSYQQQPGTSWKNPGKDVASTDNHPVVGPSAPAPEGKK